MLTKAESVHSSELGQMPVLESRSKANPKKEKFHYKQRRKAKRLSEKDQSNPCKPQPCPSLDTSPPFTAFKSPDEFRQYFSSKPDKMRELLIMYTRDPGALSKSAGPMYHQSIRGVKNDQLQEHFFASFKHVDFGLKDDGSILPNRFTLTKVKTAATEVIDKLEPALQQWNDFLHGLKLRRKGADDCEKSQAKTSLSEMDQIFNYIISLRSSVRDFTADGGKTNGEFRLQAIKDLLTAMKECGVNDKDCVGDMGAAYGFLVWLATQFFECPGYGIEIELERNRIAAEQALRILQDQYAAKILKHTKVGHYSCDLNAIDIIAFVTVAISFDSVTDTDVLLRLYDVLAANPQCWMIVTSKALRDNRLHKKLEDLGFQCSKTVPCAMTISGEEHSMGIYERPRPQPDSAPYSPPNPSWLDADLQEQMRLMLHSNDDDRVKAYQELYENVDAVQSEQKNRRKANCHKKHDGSFCAMPDSDPDQCHRKHNFKCIGGKCQHCNTYFDHHFWAAIEGSAGGVFARTDIHPRTFIMSYDGKPTTTMPRAEEECKRAVKLAHSSQGGGFVVVNDVGDMSSKIKHVCEMPNCAAVRWSDDTGVEQFSVFALKAISAGQELTINYGRELQDLGFVSCECPSCRTQTKNNVLLACMKYGDEEVEDVTWKDMDKRDLSRIKKMEEQNPEMTIFTTNKSEIGAPERKDRHFYADFSTRHWLNQLKAFVKKQRPEPEGFFQLCIWDYMWCPNVYCSDTWGDRLFKEHIHGLASLLSPTGSIILPCNKDILMKLAKHESFWDEYYQAEFIYQCDQAKNPLWLATQELSRLELSGKSNDTLHITAAVVKEALVHHRASNLINQLKKMKDPQVKQIRFLRLVKKPQQSQNKKRKAG